MSKFRKILSICTIFILIFGTTADTVYGKTSKAAGSKITLNTKSIALTKGKAQKISVKSPTKLTKVVWKSSNKKIATVSTKGVVKAVGAGSANITITAVVKGKKLSAVCRVTVKNPSMTLSKSNVKNGMIIKSNGTYENITIKKTVGAANIDFNKITAKNLILEDGADYSVLISDSKISNVIVKNLPEVKASEILEELKFNGNMVPDLVADKDAKINYVSIYGNIELSQKNSGTIGPITVKTASNESLKVLLKNLVNSIEFKTGAQSDSIVWTENCKLNKVRITGNEKGQNIWLLDKFQRGSSIKELVVENTANIVLDIQNGQTVVESTAANTKLEIKSAVDELVNHADSTKTIVSGIVKEIIAKGENTKVTGNGTVEVVRAEGNNTVVETKKTKVEAAKDVTGTMNNGIKVDGGTVNIPGMGGSSAGDSGWNTGGEVGPKTEDYYVDAFNGNDENDGKTQSTPWKSLDKVNNTIFSPNSKIMFKKGQAWSGNLIVSSSGKAGKPIVYTSYGTGEKPLINGLGDHTDGLTKSCTAAVLVKDKEYVTIQGFAVTNLGKKPDGTPNDVDELGVNEELRSGIMVMGTRGLSTVLNDIKILDNEVYNVKGSSNRYPVAGTYDMYHNAGIYMWLEGTKGDTAQFNGLLIENNLIRDMSCQGINFNVEEASYYNFQHDRYNQNVVIKGNSIARTGADAIVVEYCNKVLVERNVGYNAGEKTSFGRPSVIAGIWQSNVNDPVFQYNECARTRFFSGDGMAWDADWGSGGTSIYQYNYSHENEGGMMMDCAFSSPKYEKWVMRNNLSVDEPGKQWTITSHYAGNVEFYNNTVYIAPGGGRIYISDKKNSGNKFFNNIFVADEITCDEVGSLYESNLIWGYGNTVELTKNAKNTWIADPGFADTAMAEVASVDQNLKVSLKTSGGLDGWHKIKGWALKSNSPAINRGITVPDNGGKDLLGNDLYYGIADIGAIEFQGNYTGDNNVPKLPENSNYGIEAESYATANGTGIISLDNGVTGFKNGDSLTYENIYFGTPVQSIRFAQKSTEDYKIKVYIGSEEAGIFTIKASSSFLNQTFDFAKEYPTGIYAIKLEFMEIGAATATIDKFYIMPLAEKPFDVPYVYTFDREEELFTPLEENAGTVTLVDGKLLLKNNNEKEYYISSRAPQVQDGIIEFEMMLGTNAKASVTVRHDLETGKFIEVGVDSAGEKYWFIDGNYNGMSHNQFDESKCPTAVSGQTYNIKIKMNGAHFIVYIDGVEVFNQTFDGLELKSGALGACKWNSNQVYLDNIRVNSGTIKGRVVGKNGVGLSGVTMSLNSGASSLTDDQGYYVFNAPVKWGKEYTVSGHAATGNLEEKKVITTGDQDVVEVDYTLNIDGVNKTELLSLIAHVKTMDAGSYTVESWAVLASALTTAEGVAGNINATETQVNDALLTLQAGIDQLSAKTIILPHTYTFTDSLEGWTSISSASPGAIKMGKMHLKSTDNNGKWAAFMNPDLKDGIVEYEFTPVVPNGFVGGKASMMVRMNSSGTNYVELGVDALDSNYWFIAGTGIDQNIVLTGAPNLIAGQTYKIKLEFQGEHLAVWIDGTKYFDDYIVGLYQGTGKLGIRAWNPTEILFDNISVEIISLPY